MNYRVILWTGPALLAGFGVALAGWPDAVLPWFDITGNHAYNDPAALDWLRLRAFARMFGETLVSLGAAVWALSKHNRQAAKADLGLVGLAFLLSAALALAQQVALWSTPAGILLAAVLATMGMTQFFAGAGGAASATE